MRARRENYEKHRQNGSWLSRQLKSRVHFLKIRSSQNDSECWDKLAQGVTQNAILLSTTLTDVNAMGGLN